jgi:UDP-glucose 4-epimerase
MSDGKGIEHAQSERILITGGAGFIGSHLAEFLVQQGHKVTVIDDLSTGRYSNIGHLENCKGFQLIIDTVLNESLLERLIMEHEWIFHLASAVGVRLILDQPVKTIETIVGGTDAVLRFCARYRRRVLITSTSEVYGKGVTTPFREEDDVLTGATSRHRWAYACAKSLDEFLALAHWRETRLPVAIVRLFNTVGPRQTGQYGMVIPRFVEAALRGHPLVAYGDGKQSRCFCHVHDVVTGLVNVLGTPRCFGQVINLGSEHEITINELAETIVNFLGSQSAIHRIPYSGAYGDGFEDMRRRVPCLDKAFAVINFRPVRSLSDILTDIADDLRRNSDGARSAAAIAAG